MPADAHLLAAATAAPLDALPKLVSADWHYEHDPAANDSPPRGRPTCPSRRCYGCPQYRLPPLDHPP